MVGILIGVTQNDRRFGPRLVIPLMWAIAAVAVVAFGLHTGWWLSAVAVGLASAVLVTWAYERLRRHIEAWRRLVAELTAAQTALAEREREAGRLAEREHLAREIHDTVGQSLASVILLLRAALGPTQEYAPAHCVAQLNTALDTAIAALAETRRMVRGLDPAAFDQGGLEEALAAQVAESSALGLPTTLAVHGTPRRLDMSAEVALLRAAQEALSNIRKHAKANRATVTLTFHEDEVTVDIVDDGCGFVPDSLPGQRPDGSGYGLTGMRARIKDRGGELTIESEPGSGTAVSATVPVDMPEPATCPRQPSGAA